MPIYKEWQPLAGCVCAIWKIEEPEIFFADFTGLQSDIKSEKRRLEFLAGRFLLRYLIPDIDLATIATSEIGKPFFLDNARPHFSLSHSYPYVGAIISGIDTVGIDVQVYQEKIVRLQHKFLSKVEQTYCQDDIAKLTLAWSAKEAVFKKFSLHGVDFIEHMPIINFTATEKKVACSIDYRRQTPARNVLLEGEAEQDFGWMITID